MTVRTVAAAAVLLAASQASAGLLFYDGFDYTSGEKLANLNDTGVTPNPGQLNTAYGYNWRYAGAGGATNQPPGVAGTGLTHPDLYPSTGNSVAFDMTQLGSARIQVAPAAVGTGTLYWSALLRVNDVNTLTTGTNGMLLGGFNNATGAGTLPTVVAAVLRIKQGATADEYLIGTGMNSGTGTGTSANVQFDTTQRSEGATVFVVGSYEFVAGASNDIARMWINPNAADFGAGSAPAPTLTSSPGGAIADAALSLISFNLRNVNTVGAPDVQLDELRVGDDWASVTPPIPEPAAATLLAAAGLGLLRRRAR